MSTFQYGGIIESIVSTVTSGGTTTLLNTSQQVQVFTGTTTQTIVLPDATTFTEAGGKFEFYNESTGALLIQNHDTTTFATVTAGNTLVIKLSDRSTSNGTWVKLSTSAAGGLYSVETPQVLTGGGQIALTTAPAQYIPVSGSGGPVVLSSTPFSSTPSDGTVVILEGQDNTNTVEIDNADLAGGVLLNGNVILGQYDIITLVYRQTLNMYVEQSRNN